MRSVGWVKLPGTAMMIARRRAILPTRLRREVRPRGQRGIRAFTPVFAGYAPCRIVRRGVGALPTLLIAGLSHRIVMKAQRFRLPRPACHQGVNARLRRAMERVGVR